MSGKLYFPGLNGLRFLAALAVIVAHVEAMKNRWGIPNLAHWPFFENLATRGVSLFFVLSGFLITYLLLAEHRKAGCVQVKKFYTRRILRIWPLYYLIVAWGFFVLPRIGGMMTFEDPCRSDFWQKILLFVFLLPQAAEAFYPSVFGAAQSWTIGIEEQFYFVWPLIVKKWAKNIAVVFVVILAGRWLAQGVLWFAAANLRETLGPASPAAHLAEVAYKVLRWCQAEKMTIGGLFAYWVFKKDRTFLPFLYYKGVQLFFLALLPVFLFVKLETPWFDTLESVMFGVIIINIACNPLSLFKLENFWLRYLGKISYGIYMFHYTAIYFTFLFIRRLPLGANALLWNVVFYGSTIALTILASAVSYRYFEAFFLNQKSKLMVIKSSDGTA